MGISINGIGVIGGFGSGIDDLAACLNSGSVPLKNVSNTVCSEGFYPSYRADTSCLMEFVSRRELRRIDHFSQIALAGAFLALENAGIDSLEKSRTGLVICSGYGSVKTTFSFLDSIIDSGDQCASPTLFSNSVHNSAAGHISILLGLSGPCLTVSQFDMSVHSALLSAIMWLEEGRADQILFGAVDESCEVIEYCYQGFFGKREDNLMNPLRPDRQSAVPGEGAVFLLLSKEKTSGIYYGSIESVKVGSISETGKTLSKNSFFILNADGHRECDRFYADIIPDGSITTCYTPLYGSLPIGPAFDMAIAALCISKGRVFPSPKTVVDSAGFQVIKKAHLLDGNHISCIKIGRQGELGIINISNNC